jgi:hypothetical protein
VARSSSGWDEERANQPTMLAAAGSGSRLIRKEVSKQQENRLAIIPRG